VNLRFWGIACLVVGILVIGTGVFAAVAARQMWVASEARCEGSGNDMCGAGESLAAAFLLVLGPVGTILGLLLALAGGLLIALQKWLDRALEKGMGLVAAALK